jgi:hypothetical protein
MLLSQAEDGKGPRFGAFSLASVKPVWRIYHSNPLARKG